MNQRNLSKINKRACQTVKVSLRLKVSLSFSRLLSPSLFHTLQFQNHFLFTTTYINPLADMFEAKLADGQTLKRIVEAIKDLVTDVNIDATPTGLSLQAMDSSHVALVNLHLSMEGFEKYRCDRNLTLGISITNLAKVMKLVNSNDSITLKCEDEPTYLTIVCLNQKLDRTTQFNINLITLDSEHLGIPETEYTSEITMNSSEFSKLCRELYVLSETVEFEISSTYVKFSVEGEVGSGSIKIQTGGGFAGDEQVTKEEDTVKLSFALRYLNLFNKAYTLSSQVKLSMAADTPLVVEYEVEMLGTLKYYLAPKITDSGN